MEKFEKLTAVAAPMPASNIDTDIIMPKAFLKRIDKEGVLEGLFHDIRLYEDGTEREEFVLNQPEYRNARILVTGPNFGLRLFERTRSMGVREARHQVPDRFFFCRDFL